MSTVPSAASSSAAAHSLSPAASAAGTAVDPEIASSEKVEGCGEFCDGYWCRGCTGGLVWLPEAMGISDDERERVYRIIFGGCGYNYVPCLSCNRDGKRPIGLSKGALLRDFWRGFHLQTEAELGRLARQLRDDRWELHWKEFHNLYYDSREREQLPIDANAVSIERAIIAVWQEARLRKLEQLVSEQATLIEQLQQERRSGGSGSSAAAAAAASESSN